MIDRDVPARSPGTESGIAAGGRSVRRNLHQGSRRRTSQCRGGTRARWSNWCHPPRGEIKLSGRAQRTCSASLTRSPIRTGNRSHCGITSLRGSWIAPTTTMPTARPWGWQQPQGEVDPLPHGPVGDPRRERGELVDQDHDQRLRRRRGVESGDVHQPVGQPPHHVNRVFEQAGRGRLRSRRVRECCRGQIGRNVGVVAFRPDLLPIFARSAGDHGSDPTTHGRDS